MPDCTSYKLLAADVACNMAHTRTDAEPGSPKGQRKVCNCILTQDNGDDDIVMHDADCSVLLDSSSESLIVCQVTDTVQSPKVQCAPPIKSSPETYDLDSRIKLIQRKNRLWLARFQEVAEDKRQAEQWAAALPHSRVKLVATSQPRLVKAPQSGRRTVKAKNNNWEKITITVVNEEAQESSLWSHSKLKKMEGRLGGRLGEEPVVIWGGNEQLITCTINNCQEATGYITDVSQSTSEAERLEYQRWKKRNRLYRRL